MMRAAILALALGLAGCATQEPTEVVDTFCLTAKKRPWSISDTAETIRDAEAWNKLVDRRCGLGGGGKA
jgi:uncharacterized lipoprotein YmbA